MKSSFFSFNINSIIIHVSNIINRILLHTKGISGRNERIKIRVKMYLCAIMR